MTKATDFEFRWRAAVFGVIYGGLCATSFFDHTPTGSRIASWLMPRTGWTEVAALRFVFGIGAALFVIAAAIRTWGSAYLGRETVHDESLHNDVLRADGPYRHVRNPLYLGNVIMSFGMGLIAPLMAYAPMVLLSLLFCYRLIGREEAGLEAAQGEPFRNFMRAVPRLLPSLTPRIPSGTGKPDWPSGWAAEAYFWSFAFGMALFAWRLNIVFFFAGLVASPAASAIAEKLLKRRTHAAAA